MAAGALAARRIPRAGEASIAIQRAVILAVWFLAWEAVGRVSGNAWVSTPTAVGARLAAWIAGPLWGNLATTLTEMAVGLVIGVPTGIALGIFMGRRPGLNTLLRPIVIGLYSVPLITLAPLLILWFGIDMKPKIVLVAVVSCFLLFFNTLSGAQSVDRDIIEALDVMGASRRETFRKVILPACSAWIISGLKIALPYALIATTVGEMIAARSGLGSLLTKSVDQVDMTGIYAALVVLMAIGTTIGEGANRLERVLLRWRKDRP